MTQVKITSAFRVAEDGGTRKYTAGEVATGRAAEIALDNGWGEEIADPAKAKKAPRNKAKPAPKNKSA